MSEIVLGGNVYSLSQKLDAFTQLHVARKLGPALPIVEGLVDERNAGKDKTVLTVLMLAQLSDADTEFVIRKCLGVVVRHQSGGRPAKIQSPDGSLMFDDIDMQTMLDLTIAVIEENLGDFFRTALQRMAEVRDQDQAS